MSRFVPYHQESVEYAKTLVEPKMSILKRYNIITHWVSKNIQYDYIKAITVPKKGQVVPDLSTTWEKRRGICLDIASLTTGMLRAVGVPAYLVFGHADRAYHAWVEATINGKTYRYDHDGKAKKYVREKIY